ncbi:MAG: ISL3 family transposase [Planctomycetes bacterium]|nr:ISL3 family transposase [Planctomycetota bacterium]
MSGTSVAGLFPWRRVKVTSLNTVEESRTAIAVVQPDRRFRPICHACGAPGAIHAQTRKCIRDLGFGDFSMLLQVEYRKIRCQHCCKVRVERLEFVDASARVTHRLAAYAAQLCEAGLSVEAVARHLDLDPKTVKAIDKAVLQAKFGQTIYDGLKRLAIDEIAVKKGHNYMTVVLDYDSGRVVWMGKGRQTATIDGFFEAMPSEVRAGIEAVAIDMWEPYIQAVKRWCPQADTVFDLFHVVKAFNKVIDEIRNEEFRKAGSGLRELLKGSKYLFLKNWGNLKREGRVQLDEILTLNARLTTIYWLKDLLAHIWDYYYPGWAMKMLAEWCAVARQDGHPALVKFAEMLERHQYGIISHCKHQIHTSKLEGVNNKIKVVKRIAYGFHDLEYFALKVKQALPGRFVDN